MLGEGWASATNKSAAPLFRLLAPGAMAVADAARAERCRVERAGIILARIMMSCPGAIFVQLVQDSSAYVMFTRVFWFVGLFLFLCCFCSGHGGKCRP